MRIKQLYVWVAALILGGICITGFSGCGESLAEAGLDPDEDCWALTDTLFLNYQVEEPGAYKLVFPATFTESYPYQNIYLYVEVVTPSGKVNGAPYNYILMNEYGEWFEKPSRGKISFELPLGRNIRLDEKGEYKFRVYHYMRNEKLCGISHIGAEVRQDQ